MRQFRGEPLEPLRAAPVPPSPGPPTVVAPPDGLHVARRQPAMTPERINPVDNQPTEPPAPTEPTEPLESPEPTEPAESESSPEQREPLFKPIEEQGDPTLPPEQKVKVIFTSPPVLRRLGVDEELCASIDRAERLARPIGSLVLNRKPKTPEERALLEGRGGYHKDVPVTDEGHTAIVYGKGSGNEGAFDQQPPDTDDQAAQTFTGFPSNPDKMLFDSPLLNAHPRILGTETARWGIMELGKACILFKDAAQQAGWKSVPEVVQDGATIPLTVKEFLELSNHMSKLLKDHNSGDHSFLEEKNRAWEGNKHLGKVTQIVPGTTRIDGGIEKDPEALARRITDPDIAQRTGRTLHFALKSGFVYFASPHGGNIYTEGRFAQADNSDLSPLGAYKGRQVEEWNERHKEYSMQEISATEDRTYLVYCQFDADMLMTPRAAPTMGVNGVHTTWEQTVIAGKAFWKEMLQDVAVPEAIDRMTHLLPFMRTEFNAAAATLLVEHADHAHWEQNADALRDIFSGYEADYGVLTEHDNKTNGNLDPTSPAPLYLSQLIEQNKLRARPIMNFLQTGDESFLRQDEALGPLIKLAEAVEKIPDPAYRDEFLSLAVQVYSNIDKATSSLHNRPDNLTAFFGDHTVLMERLVSENRLDDAHYVLSTLSIALTGGISSIPSHEQTGERFEHMYPRKLLEPDAPYENIYHQAKLDATLKRLAQHANTGGHPANFFALLQTATRGSSTRQGLPLNVTNAATKQGLPSAYDAIRLVLNSPHITPTNTDRQAVVDWTETYNETFTTTDDELTPEQTNEVFDELDRMTASMSHEYPELALAHHCIGAGTLAKVNPARAQAYFEAAMDYYRTDMRQRLWQAQRTDPTKLHYEHRRKARDQLIARYAQLGYDFVATYYGTEDTNKPIW